MKAVLPNLDGLHVQVKAALESTAESELRSDAIKVHEALLVRPCGTCSIVAYIVFHFLGTNKFCLEVHKYMYVCTYQLPFSHCPCKNTLSVHVYNYTHACTHTTHNIPAQHPHTHTSTCSTHAYVHKHAHTHIHTEGDLVCPAGPTSRHHLIVTTIKL